MNIIKNIISRDCHVGLSNRQVMQHVISKLKRGYATFAALPKGDRKELLKQCKRYHEANRKLYGEVINHITQ